MMQGLPLGSGDLIALVVIGWVRGQVYDERLSSSGFRFHVLTSCLGPFFLYVA